MRHPVIHRLNTGWYECTPAVGFQGEGRHPQIPGGQIRSYGWRDDIQRPDGTTVNGAMAPVAAWYIETGDKRILVDTGSPARQEVDSVLARYGLSLAVEVPPMNDIETQLLNKFELAASEIDIVIQTHLHFDHVGANHLFSNADFIVNSRELPWALDPPRGVPYYYAEFSHFVREVLDRVQTFDDTYHVAPGIQVVHTGGHTPGHSVVFVQTEYGEAVIAGDAAYNYRNVEYEWLPGVVFDVEDARRAIQIIKRADSILLTHDSFFEILFPDDVVGRERPLSDTTDYMLRLRTGGAFPLSQYEDMPYDELQRRLTISSAS